MADGDAFTNFNNQDAAGKLDACLAPRMERFLKSFDDFMNWLVFEGIPNACGRVKDWAADNLSKGVQSVDNFEAGLKESFSGKSPDTPRSQQQICQEPSLGISQEIGMQAKMAIGSPNQFQCMDVGSDCNVVPTAVGYGMQQSQGQGIGAWG